MFAFHFNFLRLCNFLLNTCVTHMKKIRKVTKIKINAKF